MIQSLDKVQVPDSKIIQDAQEIDIIKKINKLI